MMREGYERWRRKEEEDDGIVLRAGGVGVRLHTSSNVCICLTKYLKACFTSNPSLIIFTPPPVTPAPPRVLKPLLR